MQKRQKKIQLLRPGNDLSIIILTQPLPSSSVISLNPFGLFVTPPDRPNQQLLPLSNQLTASLTLIFRRASLMKLAVFPSYLLCLGGRRSLYVYLLDYGPYIYHSIQTIIALCMKCINALTRFVIYISNMHEVQRDRIYVQYGLIISAFIVHHPKWICRPN
jgi:hypothetical protein